MSKKKDVLVEDKKKGGSGRVVWWVVGLSALAIVLLVGSALMFTDDMLNTRTFHDNTEINGIDVSGMDREEASNLISSKMLSDREGVSVTLSYREKEWNFEGTDFEPTNEISESVNEAFQIGRDGNVFQKRAMLGRIKRNGMKHNISYKNILGGIDEKIDKIILEIERAPVEATVTFNPDAENMFKVNPSEDGIAVDRESLYAEIDRQFVMGEEVNVEIPVIYEAPESNSMLQDISLRSKFNTLYKDSTKSRKNNVKRALRSFNGKVVSPGEEVSFNAVTGSRSEENGYEKANIILSGVFVEGSGGGVCQASTTLYNAIILSDLDVTEVSQHSLPVSYVPLAFDAMVAEGYSDLKFRNNTEYPIYIKAWGDDDEAHVEIYGAPLETGVSLRRKADFIRVIPHGGDKIVQDINGEYSNKITYKGEYLRIKYPQEGYESNAYIEYAKDGKVVGEKMIRHAIYNPQDGLIIEGTEDIGEGMELPKNEVKFIGPQSKQQTTTEKNIEEKIKTVNPEKYNP